MTETDEVRGKSNKWILLALATGFLFGLSNVAMGINLSQEGLLGTGFIGPIIVLVGGVYRFGQAVALKYRTGHWIDKANSNYWRVKTNKTATEAVGDDFQPAINLEEQAEKDVEYELNSQNIKNVVLA